MNKKIILLVCAISLLVFIGVNNKLVKPIINRDDYLGRFQNQLFFDNGKEIYTTELLPRVIFSKVMQ